MRKVVGKAFTAGGRFDFFLDSAYLSHTSPQTDSYFTINPRDNQCFHQRNLLGSRKHLATRWDFNFSMR